MKKNLKAENSSNDNYLTNVKETLCGFAARHIGLSADDINHMLDTLGYKDIDAFTEAVVPKNILNNDLPDIGEPLSEQSALKKLKEIAKKNVVVKSMIGQGYYSGYMPNVIKRNVLKIQAGIHPILLIKLKFLKGVWKHSSTFKQWLLI